MRIGKGELEGLGLGRDVPDDPTSIQYMRDGDITLHIVHNPICINFGPKGASVEDSETVEYPDGWFWKYVYKSGTRLAFGREDYFVMLSPEGWRANKKKIEKRFKSSPKFQYNNAGHDRQVKERRKGIPIEKLTPFKAWIPLSWKEFCQKVEDHHALIKKNTEKYLAKLKKQAQDVEKFLKTT